MNAYLIFRSLAAVSLVIGFTTGSLAADPFTTRTVVYNNAGDRELKLELIEPTTGDEGTGDQEKRPAIVFFHGGGWSGGNYSAFRSRARRFAAKGITGVLVEYRLIGRKPNDPPVVCIQDAKRAMRWVRSHAEELHIDPERIAACGSSAGGHLTACVGMLPGVDDPQDDLEVSSRANAMIMFCPVLDNGPDGGYDGGPGYGHERCGPEWKKYSPAHHVTKEAPPALVMMGDNDHLIPVATLERFQKKMQEANARCDLHVFKGTHSFASENGNGPKTIELIEKFLVSLEWLREE
jgi:acetyl esterase